MSIFDKSDSSQPVESSSRRRLLSTGLAMGGAATLSMPLWAQGAGPIKIGISHP